MGPKTQGGSLALRCYHQADLCILGMVAWLPDDQCQEETKQSSNISLLSNNWSHAHYSHQCFGSNYLPPSLELVIEREVRSAAYRLWSLGGWSYLHPNGGHCSILLRLQQSGPTFNMGVDFMRPIYNFEPQYRVTMLTRENWTKATGAPPAVKGLVWFTDGSKLRDGVGAGVYGQSVRRRLSFLLGRYTTNFQLEIYAILACAYEIQSQNRPEKYVTICSDSLAALRVLEAVRTTSPLVHQCQKVLNEISSRHAEGLFWVPGHAGVRDNEIADGLTRGGPAQRFLRPEPTLGVSRQDLQRRLNRWLGTWKYMVQLDRPQMTV